MSLSLVELEQLPENVLTLKHKDVNVNIDGDIVSITDLEKIFFLSKLNPDPSFIASILKLDIVKIDHIIHSTSFQSTINSYLSEYVNKNVGEGIHELTLRYSDFLKECFISLRLSVGMRIRKAVESDRALDAKWLNIPTLEKLMKLEFALHGLPIDLRGVVVGHKKSSDKTNDELVQSVKEINETLSNFKEKTFEPKKFLLNENNNINNEEILNDIINNEIVVDGEELEKELND